MSRNIRALLLCPLAGAAFALTPALASAPASAAPATTSSAGTAPAGHSATSGHSGAPSAAAAAKVAREALKGLTIGHGIRMPGSAGRAAPAGTAPASGVRFGTVNQLQTGSWSGYAVTGSGFSSVTASWTEPRLTTCSSGTEQLVGFWPGIGGFSTATVQQDGTLDMCYQGQEYHYTWWETYPGNAAQVMGSTVAPGDAITATVTRSGTDYTMSVTDSTHPANSFTTTQSCSACDYSTAEWVGENVGYPVPGFGTWKPRNATAASSGVSGPISAFPSEWEIATVGSTGNVEMQPSALSASGTSFTDTWKASS